ncbi:hypothetical protein GE09DRAFT_1193330, partial [Coniochaeta sp. 2T2.1]
MHSNRAHCSPFLQKSVMPFTRTLSPLLPKYLLSGKIVISRCLEPGVLNDRHADSKLRPKEGDGLEVIWGRRLSSTWASHWQCEEIALESEENEDGPEFSVGGGRTTAALLCACKRLQADIGLFIVRSVTLYVTDLEILQHLSDLYSGSQNWISPYSVLFTEIQLLRSLDITLRLPFLLLRALGIKGVMQGTSVSRAAEMHTRESEREWVSAWMRVWSSLAPRLPELRRLNIWLDHDDSKSWTVLNERAILSPIITSISPTTSDSLQDVTLSLPKTHPRYEHPERHYLPSGPPPPPYVTIERLLRRMLHYEETRPGTFEVVYKPDFPAPLDLIDFSTECRPDLDPIRIAEEIERTERVAWGMGEDPQWEIMGLQNGWMGRDSERYPPMVLGVSRRFECYGTIWRDLGEPRQNNNAHF